MSARYLQIKLHISGKNITRRPICFEMQYHLLKTDLPTEGCFLKLPHQCLKHLIYQMYHIYQIILITHSFELVLYEYEVLP